VLGYSEDELLARPFVSFVRPDDVAATQAVMGQLEGGEAIIDFENRYQHKDGRCRWISWRSVPVGRERRIYAVGRDVTESRALQDQLRHSQKLEAIGQLAGGIAHDFNNLLQAIQVNSEFALRRAGDPARVAKHVGEIAQASAQAAELTGQLLAFSRRHSLTRETLDLDELSGDMLALVERLLPENIEVVVDGCGMPCRTEGDRALLEQVLLNLCLNARDAMPRGGRLHIETARKRLDARYCERNPWARPGRYAVLCVSDTGEGMEPEVMERVFEPFFTAEAHGKGTGLGLATAYGIVRQHGGCRDPFRGVPARERGATPGPTRGGHAGARRKRDDPGGGGRRHGAQRRRRGARGGRLHGNLRRQR
jgi:signal transduction histidine kinase